MRTRRLPKERLVVLTGLGVASLVCVALELFRERHYGEYSFRFLLWNLELAWIPLLLAIVVYDCYRRGTSLVLLSPAIAFWLLFLPNAPYIATDFVHLTASTVAPLWFDGVVIASFACTGVVLGCVSLYLLHTVARDRFGPAVGWVAAFATLVAAGAGVYIGRFLQWNSWDLVVRPGQRLPEIARNLDQAPVLVHAAAITFVVTGLLAATYLAFYYTLAGLRIDAEPRR